MYLYTKSLRSTIYCYKKITESQKLISEIRERSEKQKKNLSDNKAPRSWAISGESVHKFLFIRFKESLSFQLVESKFAIWVAEILWRLWLASSLEWICKHDEEETTKKKLNKTILLLQACSCNTPLRTCYSFPSKQNTSNTKFSTIIWTRKF